MILLAPIAALGAVLAVELPDPWSFGAGIVFMAAVILLALAWAEPDEEGWFWKCMHWLRPPR
jgi:hypothetical protein